MSVVRGNSALVVIGLDQLLRALDGQAADMGNTVPALEEAAERAYYPVMAEMFETEGFGRWRRRSPSYERRLRRRYGDFFDLPIGQVTGGLKRSFQKGAPSNFHVTVGNDSLLVGSRRAYARHFSNERPIELREQDVERIEDELAGAMKRRSQERGFRVL